MLPLYKLCEQASNLTNITIQRGTVAATTTGVNVTIAKVNPDRCMLHVASGRATNDSIEFVNNTTIKVITSTNGNVTWQVIEMGVED